MLRKLGKEVEKEVEHLRKDEEKVLATVRGFKVRKKLIFSLLLSIFVFVIGFQKIDSMRIAGHSVAPIVVLITVVLCGFFLGLTVIRKDPERYLKQAGKVFAALFVLFCIIFLLMGFSIFDVLFLSIIITTVALSIYDTF